MDVIVIMIVMSLCSELFYAPGQLIQDGSYLEDFYSME